MSSKSSQPDRADPTTPRAKAAPRRVAEEQQAPRLVSRRTLFGVAATAGISLGVGLFAASQRPAGNAPAAPESQAGANILAVDTARGQVSVQAVADGVARIRIHFPGAAAPPSSYAIERELPRLPARIETGTAAHSLATGELSVSVDSGSGQLVARNAQGVEFLREVPNGFTRIGDGYRWQLELPADEACHGLGQRAFGLSLRHRKLSFWNYDARSYPPGSDPLYLSVPFYLGHRPELSYGIFWDNPARATIDLDSRDDGALTYQCGQGPADIYLVVGSQPQQVVERFTQLTGTMTLPPLWALGYHQSRWSYRDETRYREVAARMRRERIPCDAIHFDIDYMDGFRVFTWDPKRFPHPKRLLADLSADGFKPVAILNPGIKVDPDYPMYQQAGRRGFLLKTPSGEALRRDAWAGSSEFPDFTNPECRSWWTDQVQTFTADGFAGLWNDMNEPSTFDEVRSLPDDTPHNWDGQGNTHAGGGHAVYGMQMARAGRDGLLAGRADQRPFVISRSGYAGLQRYATTWNGDSLSTWGHLRITIPQLLNLGMSGIAFSGSDAGGFRGDPSSELYLRWMQLSSMTPFFRTHSARTAPERNPWSYGKKSTKRIRKVIERRYRLLPYLYTLVQRASVAGTPIVRPMFFEHPDLPEYQGIDDQFMLGDRLLVAPIIERGARSRTVVLPPGTWYRLGQGDRIRGGRSIKEKAGLGLPLFVRAGTVLPTWPVRQHTTEAVKTLVLQVYPGDGSSRLYEDAGDGFGYRDGDFRLSTFDAEYETGRLRISWKKEGSFPVPYSRVVVNVFGFDTHPGRVLRDGKAITGEADEGGFSIRADDFGVLELRP